MTAACCCCPRLGRDIDPVQLPTASYLDDLKASELTGMKFELVGYGVQPTWRQSGGTEIPFIPDGKRGTGFSKASSLTAAWLRLLQSPQATWLGGICLFDSWSPQFVPGARMIVSTTSRPTVAATRSTRTTGSTRREPKNSWAGT